MLFWGRSDISIGSRHTSERLVFVKKQKKTNILRFAPFTKGLRHHFVIALLGTVVSVFANYMTPQVIRVTVDSVINDEPFNLPAFITGWINSLGGREFLQHNIILCALVSVGFALLSHSTMYVSRINMAKGCEGTAKKIRDKLFSHIQRLPYA